jgi:hypothetical protein
MLRLHVGFALAEYGHCLAALDRHTEAVAVLRESLDCLQALVFGRITRAGLEKIAAGQTLTRSLLTTGANDEAVAVATWTPEWSGAMARVQWSFGRSMHGFTLGLLAQAQMSTGDHDASWRTATGPSCWPGSARLRVPNDLEDDRDRDQGPLFGHREREDRHGGRHQGEARAANAQVTPSR